MALFIEDYNVAIVVLLAFVTVSSADPNVVKLVVAFYPTDLMTLSNIDSSFRLFTAFYAIPDNPFTFFTIYSSAF
jgi:hypothetical protein